MKFKNRVKVMILSMLTAVGMLFTPPAAASDDSTPLTNLLPDWPEMSEINEMSGIVMDADTGGILYSLNRNTIRYPASTTKILTALVTLENASMDEIVTIDETGLEYVMSGSTNAQTVAGEQFTVEQCLYVMLLKSANDIATQLGKHVGGEDLDHFMEMMNARAAEIGCTDTHFVNPSGMPDSEHYSTAEDMAKIMRECLKNEEFRKIIATTSYTVPPTNMTSTERTYDNHCRLVLPDSEFYYEPCIGGKTGYTDAAWRTLVCAAEKDGRTLIAVTMKGPDNTDFYDMKQLFEYGFNNFEQKELDGVTVDLPEGFDDSVLTEEQEVLSDGTTQITWKYNNLPVGSKIAAAPTSTPEPTPVETDSVGEEIEEADPEPTALPTKSRSGVSSVGQILMSALMLILLLGIAGCAIWYIYDQKYGKKNRKKRRRKAERPPKKTMK